MENNTVPEVTTPQFPIYRKISANKEWYRFDSKTTLLNVRRNQVIGYGIAYDIPAEVFNVLMSQEECTKEEFDATFKLVKHDLLLID